MVPVLVMMMLDQRLDAHILSVYPDVALTALECVPGGGVNPMTARRQVAGVLAAAMLRGGAGRQRTGS